MPIDDDTSFNVCGHIPNDKQRHERKAFLTRRNCGKKKRVTTTWERNIHTQKKRLAKPRSHTLYFTGIWHFYITFNGSAELSQRTTGFVLWQTKQMAKVVKERIERWRKLQECQSHE